jgi:hypothetical protein
MRHNKYGDCMPRVSYLAALFLACWTTMALAAPVERRVYKVDSVIATLRDHALTIRAKGAVQTGGWRKPRLRVMRGNEPRVVVVEMLAEPPPPGMTVIEALVPVTASLVLKSRAASVHVQADENEITSQVLR